eukprot:130914-Rhodomonas_salina.1
MVITGGSGKRGGAGGDDRLLALKEGQFCLRILVLSSRVVSASDFLDHCEPKKLPTIRQILEEEPDLTYFSGEWE